MALDQFGAVLGGYAAFAVTGITLNHAADIPATQGAET